MMGNILTVSLMTSPLSSICDCTSIGAPFGLTWRTIFIINYICLYFMGQVEKLRISLLVGKGLSISFRHTHRF